MQHVNDFGTVYYRLVYEKLRLQEPMEGLVQKLVGQLHKRPCPHGC